MLYKICLFILLYLFNICVFCQNHPNTDTINSNIFVKFKKVKQSFREANTASMLISYMPKSDSIIINFDVPSFNFRLNTSITDYCIVNSNSENIKLQNKVEAKVKGINQDIYGFTFIVLKESLIKLLSSEIKNITFFFTPNEDKVKKYLTDNIYMSEGSKKYFIKLSKKTIHYKVSKPDKEQYEQLITWLEER